MLEPTGPLAPSRLAPQRATASYFQRLSRRAFPPTPTAATPPVGSKLAGAGGPCRSGPQQRSGSAELGHVGAVPTMFSIMLRPGARSSSYSPLALNPV